jgi:hypothetical protein
LKPHIARWWSRGNSVKQLAIPLLKDLLPFNLSTDILRLFCAAIPTDLQIMKEHHSVAMITLREP